MAQLDFTTQKQEYLRVFYGLIALTILTVVAALVHFPESWGSWGKTMHIIVGLIIATVKAAMVVWIFQHIKFDPPGLRVFILVPLFFAVVLIGALMVFGV